MKKINKAVIGLSLIVMSLACFAEPPVKPNTDGLTFLQKVKVEAVYWKDYFAYYLELDCGKCDEAGKQKVDAPKK